MSKSGKGSIFERAVAKKLSLWWTQDMDEPSDAVFWRTSQSGGRATTRRKTGKATVNQAGDICATDPIGMPLMRMFAMELKRGYSKFSPFDAIDRTGKPSVFEQWVEQAEESRKQAKAFQWMIIFQRTRKEVMVAIPEMAISKLSSIKPHAWIAFLDGVPVFICRLDTLLGNLTPKRIIETLSRIDCRRETK